MHVRRALVLLAMVVGLAAVAAGLAPRQQTAPLPRGTAPPPPPPPITPTVRLTLDLGRSRPARAVPPGVHLILTAEVPLPGQVSFLGSVQAAEPGTPAVFDLFAPGQGSHPVVFVPSAGGPERRGTVSVRQRR
jgi:hypothetical protein